MRVKETTGRAKSGRTTTVSSEKSNFMKTLNCDRQIFCYTQISASCTIHIRHIDIPHYVSYTANDACIADPPLWKIGRCIPFWSLERIYCVLSIDTYTIDILKYLFMMLYSALSQCKCIFYVCFWMEYAADEAHAYLDFVWQIHVIPAASPINTKLS